MGGTHAFEDLVICEKNRNIINSLTEQYFQMRTRTSVPTVFSFHVYKYPGIYMCTKGHHSTKCQLLLKHLYAGLEIKHILDSGRNGTFLQ